MIVVFCIIFVVLVALILLFIWMKFRMKVSKGRFSMTVISAMVTCFLCSLAAIKTPLTTFVLSIFFEQLSFVLNLMPIPFVIPTIEINTEYFVSFLAVIVMVLIYKFGVNAIKNWDAPPRVSEINLIEKNLENSLVYLGLETLKLLIKRQEDPVASDAVEKWKNKITSPPRPIETKDLLKDMLVSSIREIRISDDGWRDDGKMWVGERLGLTNAEKKPVLALVFDMPPDEKHIECRIDMLEMKFDKLNCYDIYVLYFSSEKILIKDINLTVRNYSVTVLTSRKMIFDGLDLVGYAKELISNFENTYIGGTTATLANSYVDLYVQTPGEEKSVKINYAIKCWLEKKSNCHLAITGEYGQGKSTALMKLCVDWASRFLETGCIGERVPLLIELRGQSPSELDPLAFISTWCARYRLLPQQVLNLIKSGDAILIFEGFDELKNAGKSYFRHQHFNALWRFSYSNTKLIFTGRPNFFLDQEEANRTLRNLTNRATGGDYYTEIWSLKKLNQNQIKSACRSYDRNTKEGIFSSVKKSKVFLDIVSRPSMLPVVATIWPEIKKLQDDGHLLTGAELIERYIQAVFSRKEAELERDRVKLDAPAGSRYLLLPKQLRELLTICIAWRMSGLRYKNTIPRSEITDMVREIYDILINVGKTEGVADSIAEGIVDFERRYADENMIDKIEAITTEICSAGLLVSDPVGGVTNLRFPHKQFFEFLIAKAIKITSHSKKSGASRIILNSSSDPRIISRLISEPNSIVYLSECVGQEIGFLFTKFQKNKMIFTLIVSTLANYLDRIFNIFFMPIKNIFIKEKISPINEPVSQVIDEDYSLYSVGRYIKKRNFIKYFVFCFLFSVVIGLLSSLFSAESLRDEIHYPTSVLFLTNLLPLILFSFFSKKEGSYFVLFKFLNTHWEHANQVPVNNSTYMILRSLAKGRVYFPVKQIPQTSNLDKFLYPSIDFGGINRTIKSERKNCGDKSLK